MSIYFCAKTDKYLIIFSHSAYYELFSSADPLWWYTCSNYTRKGITDLRKNGYRLTDTALKRLGDHIRSMHGDMPNYRLAEILGVSKDTLRRILQQDPATPTVSLDTIQRFADTVNFDLHESDYEYNRNATQMEHDNPFVYRGCIRDPAAFWGREQEINRIQNYLRRSMNCVIVGGNGTGKSSLLRHLAFLLKNAPSGNTAVALLDTNDVRTHSEIGMLQVIAEELGWDPAPTTDAEFNSLVARYAGRERQHILMLDNFDGCKGRQSARFWDNLRWVSEVGVTMIFASTVPMDRVIAVSGYVSPLNNTFVEMMLPPFTVQEAEGFVRLRRDGVPAFTSAEVDLIVSRSKSQPLALQILCFHMLQRKLEGGSSPIETVLCEADEEIGRQIVGWNA